MSKVTAADVEYGGVTARQKAGGWDARHRDSGWRLAPAWGASLRAVRLPDVGGDTIWVDVGLARDGRPDDVTGRLDGLPERILIVGEPQYAGL